MSLYYASLNKPIILIRAFKVLRRGGGARGRRSPEYLTAMLHFVAGKLEIPCCAKCLGLLPVTNVAEPSLRIRRYFSASLK